MIKTKSKIGSTVNRRTVDEGEEEEEENEKGKRGGRWKDRTGEGRNDRARDVFEGGQKQQA